MGKRDAQDRYQAGRRLRAAASRLPSSPRLINRTLERAGGSLANLVTMTVFINDARYGDRFVAIRREHFPDGRYPCSALLTISAFARPGIVIAIQGVTVI